MSTIFDVIQFQEGFISVFNGNSEAGDLLTPMFECISHSLEFLPNSHRRVGASSVFNGFVPSLFHHLHKTRVSDPIRFKPENLAFWDGRLNDHITWGVVRDGLPQWAYQSVWKGECPV